jgi:RIO kinase 2
MLSSRKPFKLVVYSFTYLKPMSSADIAVKTLLHLEPEDFRVLQAIELAMAKHAYVPDAMIPKLANLNTEETGFRIKRLDKLGLTRRWYGAYVGFVLNMAGYDTLAINALVKANVLQAFGKPLGIGKEADVYEALTPKNRRVAVKFHRLGRTSFRQTRRKRGHIAERMHTSWLYQSRLAAEKEYGALKLLYPYKVAVPKPFGYNRHVVVMDMIDGAELFEFDEIPEADKVLEEVLLNLRKAYMEAGVIHADLSEYNIILKPTSHILIIDWPQYVKRDHPNAEALLERDVKNVLGFFKRKFGVKPDLEKSLSYVRGEDE